VPSTSSGLRKRAHGAVVATIAFAALLLASPAHATPVAASDDEYQALGRVFPDPLAGCQNLGEGAPCSPYAQGNVPAMQFVQYQEFLDALRYMNTSEKHPQWSRYMEVWPLDGKLGDGSSDEVDVAGNDLDPEFDPKPEYVSAGLPTSTLERRKSDLIVVRVTDESVPDAGKKRYTLSLSIHGIERAGAEGGIRAMEDLVTAEASKRLGERILPEGVEGGGPTFEEVLRRTIVYFTFPNPDGWRRGSVLDFPRDDLDGSPGVFFQRYNGNGIDPNRDWVDIGFSFRGYSGRSEPETRAFSAFYEEVREHGDFAAGDDLHGMPFADAFSYTLLPHGRHDYEKDTRIREAAKTINRVQYEREKWSPYIRDNSEPQDGQQCVGTPLGDACSWVYAQTWGTVYDTINYTTTGTLGDWFDSTTGLGADGIDNEMAFSHLDKNIVFDPHTEQLHVDGNKALIYAHLAEMLDPPQARFDVPGRKGYVPNQRVTRDEQAAQPPSSGEPADPIEMGPKPQTGTETIYDRADGFVVPPGQGGMRIEVTSANAQGVGTGMTTLLVQCKGCDDRHGEEAGEEWATVAEDFNQSPLYLQSGVTATVNRPEASSPIAGETFEWRLVVGGPHVATRAKVTFTDGPASADGENASTDPPPRLAGYDVANTDFFQDLDRLAASPEQGVDAVDPRAVVSGDQSLAGLDSLVLADDPLPGYTGPYGKRPAEPADDDFEIESEPTIPGIYEFVTDERVPGSYTRIPFSIGGGNARMTVEIGWGDAGNDFDMFLYRVDDGEELEVGRSQGTGGSGTTERIAVSEPRAGDYALYVDNWLATDSSWTGSVSFEPFPADDTSDTGEYTVEEKDAWMAKLRAFVDGGGNLVLTDGALRALPDLNEVIPRSAVSEQNVYVGQVAFSDGEADTLAHPLAEDVNQPGSRFNSGMRRQTFEPTPLGFAIQDPRFGVNDESTAPQFDVDREAWEAAGGSIAATGVNSGSDDAQPVVDRVAIGELQQGEGRIRIAGSLLPQPSQQYDHPLGVEPYAVTYTGYILTGNLLDWEAPAAPPSEPPPSEPPPTSGSEPPPSGTGAPAQSTTPGGEPAGVADEAGEKAKGKKCKGKGKKKAGKRKGKKGKKCKGKGKGGNKAPRLGRAQASAAEARFSTIRTAR
jgi:hypothetical protein